MKKSKLNKLHKQYLRDKVSKASSYLEIYLSVVILIGIFIISLGVIGELKNIAIVVYNGHEVEFQKFLVHTIELIIGIEFVKMLAKHTTGSAIDVLLFTIARKLITDHPAMLDSLLGVVAIAILFAVKRYLVGLDDTARENELILNGGTPIDEVNKLANLHITPEMGNTLAGVLSNLAKDEDEKILPGYQLQLDNSIIAVYSMDGELIKQVSIRKIC